jgi:hypothetical protein
MRGSRTVRWLALVAGTVVLAGCGSAGTRSAAGPATQAALSVVLSSPAGTSAPTQDSAPAPPERVRKVVTDFYNAYLVIVPDGGKPRSEAEREALLDRYLTPQAKAAIKAEDQNSTVDPVLCFRGSFPGAPAKIDGDPVISGDEGTIKVRSATLSRNNYRPDGSLDSHFEVSATPTVKVRLSDGKITGITCR